MRKKALAIAVGALFAAPAAHAQITFGNDTIGTVQFYGKLYPQFGVGKADGATAPGTPGVSTLVAGPTQVLPGGTPNTGLPTGQRNAVDSQNSYLGFRGERKLMEDLKAIWQVEQSINLDNGTGTWSSRNTFAGLSHTKFGTVKLGNMDTVYKDYGDLMQMFGVASGNFVSASNVLSHIGIGNNNAARFHERRANSVVYETATFAGMNAAVMYGPDETRGTVAPGARATNANLWSYGVKWNSEMVYLSLAQEIHNDNFGGSNNVIGTLSNLADPNAHSTDRATRASSEIRFLESQRVTLDVSRLSYRERGQQLAAPRFESYIHTTWAVGWDGNFGPWGTAIQYVRAGNGSCTLTGISTPCDTVGLQGTMISAGVRFRFDRQTFVYGIVSKLNNGPSARYDNWANDNPERGADIKQAAIGISYSF
jgi:predicted porin